MTIYIKNTFILKLTLISYILVLITFLSCGDPESNKNKNKITNQVAIINDDEKEKCLDCKEEFNISDLNTERKCEGCANVIEKISCKGTCGKKFSKNNLNTEGKCKLCSNIIEKISCKGTCGKKFSKNNLDTEGKCEGCAKTTGNNLNTKNLRLLVCDLQKMKYNQQSVFIDKLKPAAQLKLLFEISKTNDSYYQKSINEAYKIIDSKLSDSEKQTLFKNLPKEEQVNALISASKASESEPLTNKQPNHPELFDFISNNNGSLSKDVITFSKEMARLSSITNLDSKGKDPKKLYELMKQVAHDKNTNYKKIFETFFTFTWFKETIPYSCNYNDIETLKYNIKYLNELNISNKDKSSYLAQGIYLSASSSEINHDSLQLLVDEFNKNNSLKLNEAQGENLLKCASITGTDSGSVDLNIVKLALKKVKFPKHILDKYIQKANNQLMKLDNSSALNNIKLDAWKNLIKEKKKIQQNIIDILKSEKLK